MMNLIRKMRFLAICIVAALYLSGCGSGLESMNKERDLDFTVVCEREIPKTLMDVIDEKRENPFQISYTNGGELYIAVGYGKQDTGGYSISVNQLYETPESIVIDTTLIGPGTEQAASPSYPYLVVKTEAIPDKRIDYQ